MIRRVVASVVLSGALFQSLAAWAFPTKDQLRTIRCIYSGYSGPLVKFTLTPTGSEDTKSIYQLTFTKKKRYLVLEDEFKITDATEKSSKSGLYTLTGHIRGGNLFRLTLAEAALLKSSKISNFGADAEIIDDDEEDELDSRHLECMPQ